MLILYISPQCAAALLPALISAEEPCRKVTDKGNNEETQWFMEATSGNTRDFSVTNYKDATRAIAQVTAAGVAVIWGSPVYGDPHPQITSVLGMGVPISLSDMSLPQGLKTLGVWGSLVIGGSRTEHHIDACIDCLPVQSRL